MPRRDRSLRTRLAALRSAVDNAGELLRKGRLGAPYRAPHSVQDTGPIHALKRFDTNPDGPWAGTTEPLLLVPPLMVTAEVYDISPELSAVAFLSGLGVDCWVVDFGVPEAVEGGMQRSLDDHVLAVDQCIQHIADTTGSDVHLAGYSQGGLFCYQAAAYRRGANVGSVIAMGSPVELHRNLPVRVADPLVDRFLRVLHAGIDAPLEDLAGLPGTLTSTGFKLFGARKELKQIASFFRLLPDREALVRREPTRKFLGGEGFVAWPGPAFREFVDEVVVHNRLASGGLVVAGRTTSLADLRCPILYFVGLRDDMAYPASVRGIRKAAPHAEHYEVQAPAGHFGLVVGSRALSITWPTVAEWLAWRAGVGEMPAAIAQEPEDTEVVAEGESQGMYELSIGMLDRLWDVLGERSVEVGGLLHALRWELPRMARMESLKSRSRVSLSRTLSEQASAIGDETFFLFEGRAFTWSQADRAVDRACGALALEGIGPGDEVGVEVSDDLKRVVVLTALNRVGAVAVVPAAEEGRKITDAGGLSPDTLLAHKGPPPEVRNQGRAADLALLLDGRPITNRRWATAALATAAACRLTPRDTVFSSLSLEAPLALLAACGGALVGGCRLAPRSPVEPFWDQVRRVGATVVLYDRDVASELVGAPPLRTDRDHPVRLFVGSGIRPEHHEALAERFGVRVLEFHAAALGSVLFANLDGDKPGSIGRRFPGSARVALVRMDARGRPVRDAGGRCLLTAPDEPGTLLVDADDDPALGLHQARELEVFPRELDAFRDGDTWLLAGDVLRRDADGDWWRAARPG